MWEDPKVGVKPGRDSLQKDDTGGVCLSTYTCTLTAEEKVGIH